MKQQLVSVIVPVYNVEKYLRRCVDSILNQSYGALEIILVNDGSPDNCGEICDEYALKDSRIKVIHKPNGGLSDARNAGLDIAKGVFIGFVDSDDYIHPDMYKTLYNNIIATESDICECNSEIVYSGRVVNRCSGNTTVYTGREALKIHLLADKDNTLPAPTVRTKLFRRELMHSIRFSVGKIHEDYYPTCQALYNAKKVCIVDLCLYSYNKTNTESITSQRFNYRDFDKESEYKRRINFLEKKNDVELYDLAILRYFSLILTFYYKCVVMKMKESEKYKNFLIENRNKINCIKFSYTRKLGFSLFYFSPRLFVCLGHIYNHMLKRKER